MKTCFKCHATKPEDEFYAHPMMADGHLGKCKECACRDAQEHRRVNLEAMRAYDRQRARLPHRRLLRNRVGQEYRKAFPHRVRAEARIGYALKAGAAIKPTRCQRCGTATARIEAHHPDYAKPLDVRWLCKPCHAIEDGLRRQLEWEWRWYLEA